MMKYLLLPLNIVNFWYQESIQNFIRTWRNIILFLEEDLAVGLMWKLLFVPLFHDSSTVGRILSFIFRVVRILVGLFSFTLASVFMFVLAICWLLLPLIALLGMGGIYTKAALVLGIGLFFVHTLLHPHRKVWQVRQSGMWEASLIKKKDLNFQNLITSFEVPDLLSHLEIKQEQLPELVITEEQKDQLIQAAFIIAKVSNPPYVNAGHFFVALMQNTPNIDKELLKLDIHISDFVQCQEYLDKKKQTWRTVCIWDDDFSIRHLKGINRGWLGAPTPALDVIAQDMTKTAAKKGFGDFLGREDVYKEVVSILSEQKNRSVILVGPPGSGKTALIRYLAKQIVTGDAPESLATKRVVLLDLSRLLPEMQTQGDLANRIKTIFEEIEFAGNVIIAIEEIHQLGEGEVGSSLNLLSLMSPYLESDNFQFIGTTELENYNAVLEKNGSFARLFTKVDLGPANPDQTLQVLESRTIQVERKGKIKISLLAMKHAIYLAHKLIHDRVLPDSAISLLEEGYTKVSGGWVTVDIINQVVSSRVKMPLPESSEQEKTKLLNLEKEIHKRMIDQEEAVKSVSNTLRRSATGLREESRPVGSFLFVGPTGVGKTELAKILSSIYYQTDGAFIRFDMSEYQNSESANRLISQLTENVKNRPFSLILLDEFEKADSKILTLFLQVLDDGRLTDSLGKTIDFTSSIIIATSNAGSLTIAKGLQAGQSLESVESKVREELLEVFRPELVNRFDEIVLFKPLSQADLEKIVRLKLNQLKMQMEDKGYLLDFDEQLISELARKGFNPVLGARPLRRLIQDTLESELSRMILEGKLEKGQQFMAGVELMSS